MQSTLTLDETEEADATVHIVTLPDGSVHERPINNDWPH